MTTKTNFENLEVWKLSMNLTIDIYKNLQLCKDFGFKDQIQRASVSIPSNIAEGNEKLTNKDSIKYFSIAKGSSGEVRTQLYLAFALGYISLDVKNELINRINLISKMLHSLIVYRKNSSKIPDENR